MSFGGSCSSSGGCGGRVKEGRVLPRGVVAAVEVGLLLVA